MSHQQRKFRPGDYVCCIKPTTREELLSYGEGRPQEILEYVLSVKQQLEKKIMIVYGCGRRFGDGENEAFVFRVLV